jgi:ATP-binding cassette, subfamily F, member 3
MNAQLVLENVGVRLPNRLLFEQVNWSLYEGMRVALAGRNGSGKSTLLKIMAGRSEPSIGRCTIVGGRKLRIGFLDQTLLESAVSDALHHKDKSLSPIGLIKQRFLSHQEGDHEINEAEQEWEIRKILGGLGFNREWMDAPYSRLSGGWLLRIFIAGSLLQKPEVLLLDEPTNHLDLSSIQWLEEFLEKEYEGSLILVTHDVALQKRTTDSLAILHGGKFFFHTHQRDYLTFRESLGEEKRLLEKNIESIQKKIEENMEFVYKFRAKAQTAARAQSKLKAAETLKEEMQQVKDRLARVEGFSYSMNFRFRLAGAGAKFPISLKDLGFKYSENSPWILKNVSLDIKRGQRVANIGDNGAGKTTLLNVIAERLKSTSGEIIRGHAVEMGYFGQHQLEELRLEDTVLDNLRATAHGVSFEEIRGWLGAFGFPTNDDIEKKAKVLSGGEKARLSLLRILVTRINLCLLDEPTNHLDVETKELLKNAIRDFEGTTIIVSHDRDFIADIADRIFYLSNDHQVTDHFGDLKSFFEKYPQFVRHVEGRAKASRAVSGVEAPAAKPVRTISYEERKKMKNQIRSLEKKVATLTEEIDKLGKEKDRLADGSDFKLLSDTEAILTAKMIEWERLSSELDKLRQDFPE